MVLCRGEEIALAHLPVELAQGGAGRVPAAAALADPAPEGGSLDLKARVEELEGRLIRTALERSGGNKAAAARLLGVSERTLWYKLKAYKVES